MHAVVLKVLQEGLVAVSMAAINAALAEPTYDNVITKNAKSILCDCKLCAEED